MPHDTNPELSKLFSDRTKVQDQLFLFDEFRITGLPAEPWTPYFKSNNFIQRSLSIFLAFNNSKKEFQLVGVDDDNRLSIKGEIASSDGTSSGTLRFLRADAGGRLLVSTEENFHETIELFNNVEVQAGQLATHAGVDVGMHKKKTLLIETTGNFTLSFQFSHDNVKWYDLTDATGAAVTITCNSTKKAYVMDNHCRFFRAFVRNDGASVKNITINMEAAS